MAYYFQDYLRFISIFYIFIIVPPLLIIGILANSEGLKNMKRIIIILSIIILLINIFIGIVMYLMNNTTA
jgi:hypothetical protein